MDKQMLQDTVGRNLQKYRANACLTQEQVAEKAGISTSFYANLERGKRSMSAMVLRSLAETLSVSADALLYEEAANIHAENVRSILEKQPDKLAMAVESAVRALVSGLMSTDK